MHNNESLAKKVLIVDDEPEMIEIIARYLTFHGYEVVTAPDGKETCEGSRGISGHYTFRFTDAGYERPGNA